MEPDSKDANNAEQEKVNPVLQRTSPADEDHSDEVGEVFRIQPGEANFRTLGWIQAAVILSKLSFATGVLGVPAALVETGYGPGVVLLVAWGVLHTYYAFIMYQFRMRYPGVHSIADAAFIMGGKKYGPLARDLTGGLFLLCWILSTGSGFIGMSIGLGVLSNNEVCSVVFTGVAAICTFLAASIRTLGKLTVLTWLGFASIFISVFIVVVGVTTVDRPAAAPTTGPFDLLVSPIRHPSFVPGLTASINLLAGYGSTPTFMPVMAEMRRPKSFPRALFVSQGFLVVSYVAFGVVMYAYCGQYVASPSLASAGGTLAKVAFGVGMIGLVMTSTLWAHVAAKCLLVRILRNSVHLQQNSLIHWGTWIGCTGAISILAFVIATAIPFFGYLLGLIGSLCCAPMCQLIPAFMSLYMDKGKYNVSWKFRVRTLFNIGILFTSSFLTVAGTYTTVQSIVDAYKIGNVGQPFSC